MRIAPPVLLAVVALVALPPGPAAAAAAGACDGLLARGAAAAALARPVELAAFYEGRDCRLAWSRDGVPLPAARILLEAVAGADRDGLRPADYHAETIAGLLARGGPLPELDVLLADAFLAYGRHLTSGRVDPATGAPEWNVEGRGRDLVFLLQAALAGGYLRATLADLAPPTPAYRSLRDALADMRAAAAAGGWPPVPPGPKLQRGDVDPRVAALRARLAAGPAAAPAPPEAGATTFDAALEAAVRGFQLTHGLEPDGVVGRRTLAALNVPAAARARQLAVNLERLRWLPRDMGPRRVVVNIPDFTLEAFTGGAEPALAMRVIAGRDARRTPFFAGEITSIVLNPTWTVPRTIALEDKLPRILENRDWLAEEGFRAYLRDGAGWREAQPGEIQWVTLGPGNFPCRLVQEPGPKNALGRVKFQIPNPHDIYLHDTPSRELFSRAERSFSSGCIRVERPRELAELLLGPDSAWKRSGIDAAIEAGATRKVPLREPMPVYLLYWTAWVDRQGVLQLREDIYGRDAPLARALGIDGGP